MENITIRELVGNKSLLLLNVFDLIKIEEVNKITYIVSTKKIVKIHVGLYNYLFSTELKRAIIRRIDFDLNMVDHKFKFAV